MTATLSFAPFAATAGGCDEIRLATGTSVEALQARARSAAGRSRQAAALPAPILTISVGEALEGNPVFGSDSTITGLRLTVSPSVSFPDGTYYATISSTQGTLSSPAGSVIVFTASGGVLSVAPNTQQPNGQAPVPFAIPAQTAVLISLYALGVIPPGGPGSPTPSPIGSASPSASPSGSPNPTASPSASPSPSTVPSPSPTSSPAPTPSPTPRPAVGTITEFPIPLTAGDSAPAGITAGPDGNLWFTERVANKIGRITPSGVITEFTIPSFASAPGEIVAGPDGKLWFTEGNADKIGRIDTSGASIAEFALDPATSPSGITSGPDGNLWVTQYGPGVNAIVKISITGNMTEYQLNQNSLYPQGITTASDGNLWFAENQADTLGRITPGGSVTEFAAPSRPIKLARARDGSLWLTAKNTAQIYHVALDGTATGFGPIDSSGIGIAAGPDGNMWFTENNNAGHGNNIGRITIGGAITEFPLPSAGSGAFQITAGPDGNMWFTETSANRIGRITL